MCISVILKNVFYSIQIDGLFRRWWHVRIWSLPKMVHRRWTHWFLYGTFAITKKERYVSAKMTTDSIELTQSNHFNFIVCSKNDYKRCTESELQFSTDFQPENQRSVCHANRDFGPGEQVFIFYGQRSCNEQFIHNGFVDINNSYVSWFSFAVSVNSHFAKWEAVSNSNVE